MKHIIYCRKSSEAEDRQAASLESQENELRALADKRNLKIDKIFTESMSARKIGRPQFNAMLEFVRNNSGCTILVWKSDRLARNFRDGGEIISLLQEAVISEIATPFGSHFPKDNVLPLAVEFGMSTQYSITLSQDVRRGNKTKLENGGLPGPAPLGYENDKAAKKIILDDFRAPLIRRCFDLYATGGFCLKEINDFMFNQGLRSKGGLRLSKALLHTILTNPFYYGMIRRKGELYQGIHQPLIIKFLFDTVQDVLSGKHRSKKQKHFFPIRGFMFCHNCGCLYTASKKKGHDYYYCTNGKGGCEQHKKYLNENKVDELVAKVFKEMKFDEDDIEFGYLAAKEKIQMTGSVSSSQKDELEKQLKIAQGKLNNLAEVISSDLALKEALKPKILSLEADVKNIQVQISKHELKTPEQELLTLEQSKKAFLQASNAGFDYQKSNPEKKFELLKILLWNLKVANQEVQQYQLKLPFQLMAESPKKLGKNEWLGR